jgi:hypothetical protein
MLYEIRAARDRLAGIVGVAANSKSQLRSTGTYSGRGVENLMPGGSPELSIGERHAQILEDRLGTMPAGA